MGRIVHILSSRRDMAAKKLTETTKVDVYNNTTYDIGYYVEGLKRREWAYGANPIIKIPLSEIENALGDIGCYNMFSSNRLLIRDEQIRDYLGLQPLENVVTKENIVDMLKGKDMNTIITTLSNAKDAYDNRVLEMFVDLSMELRITDFAILGNIKEYTGKDVEEMIKELVEEDAKKDSKKKK